MVIEASGAGAELEEQDHHECSLEGKWAPYELEWLAILGKPWGLRVVTSASVIFENF